ncbi:MAG: hypothetical protein IT265_07030 [Saprospiraceae bacterium]|nr:hypothetical protein [Saprospiraceae bacterium]
MSPEIIKFILNSGTAVAILCFVLWYVLKPLVTAYIASIKEVTENMKEQTEAMHKAQQVSQELFIEIINKIHASKEEIINHINTIKK